ncbi:MAG: tetratricopeptide repeat protein [Chthoniobacteraceae bacterium]
MLAAALWAALCLPPAWLRADPPPAETAGQVPLTTSTGNTFVKLPPAAEAAAEAGIEALSKGKIDAAETAFLKLLDLSPDNVSALVNLGLIEFRLGRQDESQMYLKRAIQLKPDAGLAWMILGVIANNEGDLIAATADLAQAVYLAPQNPQAHNYFAVVLSKRGWYSAAEDELQKAIELSPDFAEAHFNLALVYLQRNPPSIELARRHYQKALDLGAAPDPDVAAKLNAAPAPSAIP